jgi:FkbM family methyltransferase
MYNFPEILRTLRLQERPLRFLAATALQKTGLSRHFKVKHKDYMLWFDQSGLSKAMWIDPNYSPVCGIEDNKFLHLLLRDGDTVLDVGANIGTIALTASGIVGSAGKVYAIEPHPRTFVSLKSNIALNKRTNMHAINVALGAHSGTILFSDSDDSQSAVIHHPSELQSQFLEVPVRRMDDLPLGKIPITLLKIDVEGYEKLVLEGGLETLARTSYIYLEAYDRFFARYGYACIQLWELLREHGFQVYRFQGGRYLAPIPLDFESSRCENFIAIKDYQDFHTRTISGILDILI